MSGENGCAKALVSESIEKAELSSSMSADSMALAMLSQLLQVLSETRSRKDIENYIEYDLDNMVESDMVITRGC